MTLPLLYRIGIAIGLGLLVGLQRQRATSRVAGIRTFPLVCLLGVVSATLAGSFGGWVVAAGVLGLAALTVMANVIRLSEHHDVDSGITTEVAVLVMFLIGAVLATDYIIEAVVAGAAVTLLLHWKAPLHAFAERMGSDDFSALMQLSVIALIILPILPNREFGPYRVLNPFEIWLMVVLIVGISMAGYVAFKLFGQKRGALAAGALGGLISSTATAVSYAQRTAKNPDRSGAAAFVITLASTVVFLRVLVEVAIVAPELLGATALPLVAMMLIMLVISGALYGSAVRTDPAELRDEEPPSGLRSAIVFGLLYAAILFAVAWAEDRSGWAGLYAVAAVSGLTDVDAITLSTAQLMKGDGLDPSIGWRVILIGSLANLLFKGGVVAVLGHRMLRARITVAFAAAVVGGGAILFFWPG